MSQQIVNEWSYGDKNTNTWLHDGDVERSAADIVALASGVSGIADTFPAAVSAGILELNAAGATQVAAIEGAGAEQVSLVGSAGAVQCSAVDSAGDAEIASLAGATSTYLGDLQDAGAVQIAAVGSAGSALITSMGTIRDEVVEAETLIVNALGGDEEGTAQEFIDQVVNAADNASAYASAASGYAVAASGYADSIVSGGYVTSSNVSELVDAAVSSGGFVTSGYVSSATVASAGVAAKIGTSTVGSTTKPVYISAGVPVSMSVVGSATNASSLGGVAASSYALDNAVVNLTGNQSVGGVKTLTNSPVIETGNPNIVYKNTALTRNQNPNSNTYTYPLGYFDSNGDYLGYIEFYFGNDNSRRARMSVYNLDGTAANIQVGFNSSGVAYSNAPTPTNTSENSTQIATTAWVTSATSVVHTTGAETIAGNKTFSGTMTINNALNSRQHSPNINNSYTLGASNLRWKEIWCNQNSINTSSDERIKQAVSVVPNNVLDAWGDVNWIQFKFNDAVEEKGTENARLHNGLIAQRVDEAFKAHGLDASKYGLFLYDEWEATPEQTDGDGNVIMPAQEAGDAYGLRYTEALCMEAAYQRRRADRAESRITALERRLDEMEAVLASLISPVGDETYEQADEANDEVSE